MMDLFARNLYPNPRAAVPALTERYALFGLLGSVVLLLAMKVWLAAVTAINWDEFYFLSQVYSYARGELDIAVNTAHVHAFQWLRLVPGDEVNQIVAARMVMALLQAGTSFGLFVTARAFAGRLASLGAVVGYLCFSYVVAFGASFRTDPICTFFLMTALAVAARSRLRLRDALAMGGSAALGVLVTIKAIFFAPALALVLIWRVKNSPDWRARCVNLIIAASSSLALLVALFLLHRASLTNPSLQDSVHVASRAFDKTLRSSGILPRLDYLLPALATNPLQWVFVTVGLASALVSAARYKAERFNWLALAGMATPLLSLIFYRNAFPYFYGFLMAPAAVLIAPALERWIRLPIAGVALMAAGLALAGLEEFQRLEEKQDLQRVVVKTIHQIFPSPVPYLDRSGMISSFPNMNFFMSGWGMENYRAEGRPLLTESAGHRPPEFLLVGHPAYQLALDGKTDPAGFLAPDAKYLKDRFVPYWGPIWIAKDQATRIPPPSGTPPPSGQLYYTF